MQMTKSKDRWTVAVNVDTKSVFIYFCEESVATLFIGDETYKDISKDDISLHKYVDRILDRAIRGDFSL